MYSCRLWCTLALQTHAPIYDFAISAETPREGLKLERNLAKVTLDQLQNLIFGRNLRKSPLSQSFFLQFALNSSKKDIYAKLSVSFPNLQRRISE